MAGEIATDFRAGSLMKERVLATAKKLLAKGLVEGTAGNISARMDDGSICITPSSIDYEEMTLDDLVVIDLDGNVLDGTKAPSSEKLLHLACYKAHDDVGAVIHSHPVYATMFAIAQQPIPSCIDEFTIYVGGEVPVTEYAMSGTDHVGENAEVRRDDVLQEALGLRPVERDQCAVVEMHCWHGFR